MNSIKLELVESNSDEWISNLKELQIQMNKFGLKDSISDEDFMILLNNLHKKYDVILDGLENCLTPSGNDALTIYVIR